MNSRLTPLSAKTGSEAEVMPTRTTAGNNAGETTAMNSAALGGFNPNLLNAHIGAIKNAVKGISGHILDVQRGGKSNPSSEADAGSMKNYDPNLGLGKAGYSRLTK